MTHARATALAYLERHAALGPACIVLPAGSPAVGADQGGAPVSALAVPPTPAADTSGHTPTAGRASAAPRLDDLPPGLIVEPPAVDLFATDPIQRAESLDAIRDLVERCTRCPLHGTRARGVPGEGPADARLVVVGEGPGRREDETGRPFVGQAGELLTKILAAISLRRDDVFICNVVKSRPPNNRVPNEEEIQACVPYLYRQIEVIGPAVILAMGGTAATTLLATKASLGQLRGKIHQFRGTPLVVTYHPAALLRNPHWKRPTWDDVRIVRQLLDR